jgi:hypothetical protein
MNSRKMMIVAIGVLAIVAAGSTVAYYQERTHAPGVQIRVDKNGLQIEQR